MRNQGVYFSTGPFAVHLKTPLPSVADAFHQLYYNHTISSSADFSDFHIHVEPPNPIRRWIRPQVTFSFDGQSPFKPLPINQSFALFEWGLNWCISNFSHQYLIIHAAVIEKNGKLAILPGNPGAGKSTLCAGLVLNGWRLLSDELTLIKPDTLEVIPIPRPVSLKNESINVIKTSFTNAFIGPIAHDTTKGNVAHLRPPESSINLQTQKANKIQWIIFPHYQSGSRLLFKKINKSYAFLELAKQAMNYSVLGETGFKVLKTIISNAQVYDFTYSQLTEAIHHFDQLSTQTRSQIPDLT